MYGKLDVDSFFLIPPDSGYATQSGGSHETSEFGFSAYSDHAYSVTPLTDSQAAVAPLTDSQAAMTPLTDSQAG